MKENRPGVRRGLLKAVLQHLQTGYQSRENFLEQEIGLTEEDITFLRSRYLR